MSVLQALSSVNKSAANSQIRVFLAMIFFSAKGQDVTGPFYFR